MQQKNQSEVQLVQKQQNNSNQQQQVQQRASNASSQENLGTSALKSILLKLSQIVPSGGLFNNYTHEYNQMLQNNVREDKDVNIEHLGECIRIVEKCVKPWTKEQWIEKMDSFRLKDVGAEIVNLQIKLRVLDKIRPRIWFWISEIKEYDAINPYRLYPALKEKRSDFDDLILQDVIRTFPSVPYFKPGKKYYTKKKLAQIDKSKLTDEQLDDILLDGLGEGQRRLFYVLRAYVNFEPTIGYTQGMNYLAGGFLMNLIPNKTSKQNLESFGRDDYNTVDQEVSTFLLFMRVCQKHNWREVYSRKMKKIRSLISHLEQKMYEIVPKIAEKIEKLKLPFHYFFDSYFFTVMMYRSPPEFCQRILDIFILEGEHIIFEVLLRMLYYGHQQIENITEEGELSQYFKQDLVSQTITQFPLRQLIPLNYLEVIHEL